MELKDWFPSITVAVIGFLAICAGKWWDGRGAKTAAAKSYNDKVFSEMVALFDELKEKAKEAESSAKIARQSADQAATEAQKRVTESHKMVSEAHKSVSEAQASAAAAQESARQSQQMVSEGLLREQEINRQLKAAWEKVDALDTRVRDMEKTNAGLVGGAIGLDPRASRKPTLTEDTG